MCKISESACLSNPVNSVGHREYRKVYKQPYHEKPDDRMQRLGIANIPENQLALGNSHLHLAAIADSVEHSGKIRAVDNKKLICQEQSASLA